MLVDGFREDIAEIAERGRYNCAGRLSDLRADWDATALSIAGYNADADCVVNAATADLNATAGDLNLSCRI